MSKKIVSVLLATQDEGFASAFCNQVDSYKKVIINTFICFDNRELLIYFLTLNKIDVLILDLQPDSFDDVEMLEIINQISKNSIVIGTGDSSPEYKIKELLEEKVQYFLMKPVKKYILLERIKFLLKERKKEKFELFTNCENYVKNIKKKRESIIIKFLYQIGASPSMKGFEYLKDAIYYAMDEKNVPYKNNKSIYNILENLHNQDSVSIGKSMKRVVDLICIKNKDNKKLSNLEFISKSALNLRLKMM